MVQSHPHFTALQQRLQQLQGVDPSADPGIPWGPTSQGRASAPAPTSAPALQMPDLQAPDLRATVAALQQRTATVTGGYAPEVPPPAPVPPVDQPYSLPGDVTAILGQLEAEAHRINALAEQQEAAIQAFKRYGDQLSWQLRHYPDLNQWSVEQFCQIHQPSVTYVYKDAQEVMILTQAPVDLYQQEREASQTAAFLRGEPAAPGGSRGGLAALWAEPMAVLEGIWQALTLTLEARSRLTALDVVTWVGGGAIARRALELLLAASPGLWPWLVGSVVALVALALYRLITRPQGDVVVMVRLLLALVGLVIGGYL